jgi:hypothetical protein
MRARILADTFTVICPKCSEPIAEPETGSHVWEFHQLVLVALKPEGEIKCVCNTPILIVVPKRFQHE